jgi:hypothetical protein
MKNKLLICLLALTTANVGYTQLNVGTGQLFIQSGAIVSVQGDVTSSTDILGPGKILLNGSANQNVNMSGFSIPNLEINNTANVTLTGNAKIGSSLLFTAGKILLGVNNLELADVATTSGGGTSAFVETNSTGKLQKDITTNLTNYVMPVGNGTLYSPVQLTTTGANTGAIVSVQSKAATEPNKHIRSTDYLNRYWPISQTGITGTLSAKGQYNSPTDVTGSEALLNGIYWNGTNWSLAGSSLDQVSKLAGATISGAGGDLYAMNKFLLLKAKALLQGPFNGTDMNDGLRSTGVLPTADPYRTATYSAAFPAVNNSVGETVLPAVFNDHANSTNIVDWIYVELRDNSAGNPGSTVIQSRSALVEKDGTIVDVDGISPVYFKNLSAGSTYTIAIRHRNHLGISTNPATALQTLNEQTPVSTLDFTLLPAASIFGPGPGTNYTTSGGKNLLWGGDANFNGSTKYSGGSNDRAKILLDLGGTEGAILSGYYSSDVNMNGQVKYSGGSNDRAFILATVLGGAEGAIRTQALPQ